MRSRKKAFAARAIVLVLGLLMPVLAATSSSAQEEPHEHPTTTTSTTRPGQTTTTTRPTTTTTQAPAPGERSTAIRYGPYAQQPAVANPDGSHGHWHSGNQFALGVQKPCTNCYITGMTADLVYPDGTRAGYSTGSQLHHMVLFNQDAGRTDATCPAGLGFLGQRFFASGDERTPIQAPRGYGYYVGSGANWNLIWDLAGMAREAKTVYYQVTYKWVPAPASLQNLEPVWFDVDQCGDSMVDVPVGQSSKSWTWTVNRPGDIVGIGGHGHDGTVNLEIRNDTTNTRICDSRAGYGETPLYIDPEHGDRHISSMSQCVGTPVAKVTNGQRVTITAHYTMAKADPGQMGISMAFIGAPLTGTPGTSCVAATNQAHATAGRATAFLIWVFARGSNAYIGTTMETSSLREGPTGTWTKVTAC